MAIRMQWMGVVALMLPVLAVAQDAEDKNGWDGTLSAGYLATSGNSESSSATAEFDATYTVNKWTHGAKGRYFSSQSDVDDPANPGETITDKTAENYQLNWKSTYSLTEKNYLFGAADWLKNRFSGYPRQVFLTAGYGRRIITTDTIEFDGELGAGYADQKAVDPLNENLTIDEDGAVVTGALDFKWNWSETSSFSQYLGANYTEDNTFWESITKVSAKLTTVLALGLSYTVQGNTDVAPGIDKTDTFTAITLDYNF